MKKNILISGATGYLGSFIANSFHTKGYEIYILLRKESSISKIESIFKDLHLIYVDSDFFLDNIKVVEFDLYINAAVSYGRKVNEFSSVVESNIFFPIKILENINKSKKFIFITFDSFYSKPEFAKKSLLPEYVLSKIQFNEWLNLYNKKFKFTILILRIEHLIGPNEESSKFNGWLVKELRKKNNTIELTKGNQIRDFIYIDEVIDVIHHLINQISVFTKKITLIDVGTGKGNSLKNFILLLKSEIKSNAILKFGSIPHRKNEIMKSVGNDKILKKIGWKSSLSLKDIVLKILK